MTKVEILDNDGLYAWNKHLKTIDDFETKLLFSFVKGYEDEEIKEIRESCDRLRSVISKQMIRFLVFYED